MFKEMVLSNLNCVASWFISHTLIEQSSDDEMSLVVVVGFGEETDGMMDRAVTDRVCEDKVKSSVPSCVHFLGMLAGLSMNKRITQNDTAYDGGKDSNRHVRTSCNDKSIVRKLFYLE